MADIVHLLMVASQCQNPSFMKLRNKTYETYHNSEIYNLVSSANLVPSFIDTCAFYPL